MKLSNDHRKLALTLLRGHGWAKSLELIGDGYAAIEKMRVEPDEGADTVEIKLTKPERSAVAACIKHFVAEGAFGIADDLPTFLDLFGVKLPKREEDEDEV